MKKSYFMNMEAYPFVKIKEAEAERENILDSSFLFKSHLVCEPFTVIYQIYSNSVFLRLE